MSAVATARARTRIVRPVVGVMQQALLAAGILAPATYIATDLIGALRYPGYSLTGQMISELAAIGAPSEPLLAPLFLIYDLLALAFGFGVLRAARGNHALTIAGVALMGHAAAGLVGAVAPDFFEMRIRGEGSVATDAPHIVLTAVIVLCLLVAMGSAAFALGRRFRTYSFVTLATVVLFGALAATYAKRIGAGLPTPGAGIVERINVYASMVWTLVLAIGLLRRGDATSRPSLDVHSSRRVQGYVAPGFEDVRAEFERNFAHRGEIGAAVAAYWRGEKVVDLWGGRRTPEGDEPWHEDTMVVVMSSTKGLAAMTLAVANARGWLDYDALVSHYWPEFGQRGKGAVTVRQLLGHEAGLVLLDEKLPIEKLRDLDHVARLLARQKPAWPPGTRHGYHTLTIGLCMQELIRRVDPAHRTLGRFFHDEIAQPLGIDFHIGLPADVPDERLARVKPLSRARGLLALRYTPLATTLRMITPGSLLRRSFIGTDLDMNERRSLEIELPAGNGVGTARAIARAYSAFAQGGEELGITPETLTRITAPPDVADPVDVVLGVPSYFSLGFLRPGPDVGFGSSERTFGSPGAGGSFGFADPDAHLGYAYVMNRLDYYLVDDPREKALRDAIYRGVARLGESDVIPSAAGATAGVAQD